MQIEFQCNFTFLIFVYVYRCLSHIYRMNIEVMSVVFMI
jgi:hypothetical protein